MLKSKKVLLDQWLKTLPYESRVAILHTNYGKYGECHYPNWGKEDYTYKRTTLKSRELLNKIHAGMISFYFGVPITAQENIEPSRWNVWNGEDVPGLIKNMEDGSVEFGCAIEYIKRVCPKTGKTIYIPWAYKK